MPAASRASQSRRRRVILVASHAPSLPLFRGDLIRAIAGHGHEVLCLAPDYDSTTEAEVQRLGAATGHYRLERTGLSPRADLASLRALTAAITDWRADVVCGYTPKPAVYASLAAHRAGVARIVPMITGLGYAFNSGGSLKARAVRQIALMLYARAFARCHGVIFHNADDAALLQQAGALPPAVPGFVVGGSGVDLERFHALPFPPPSEGIVFLMIARLVRYKGVVEFCEAARALKARSARARFILAGPPETGPAGVPLDIVQGYADAVDYVGPQTDVHGLLARCHVYVLPSHGEGLPRTVLEAMAVGRPVITTTARGCRDTVVDGVNGRLVPVGDSEALSEAMRTMLMRPDLLPGMAAASRRMVTERFDVRLVTGQMLAALGLND